MPSNKKTLANRFRQGNRKRRQPLRIRSGYQHCRTCKTSVEHLDNTCLECHPHYRFGLKQVPRHLQDYLPGGV